jgi:hypothetical protein
MVRRSDRGSTAMKRAAAASASLKLACISASRAAFRGSRASADMARIVRSSAVIQSRRRTACSRAAALRRPWRRALEFPRLAPALRRRGARSAT